MTEVIDMFALIFAISLFFIEMLIRMYLRNYAISLVIYVQRSFRRIHFNKSVVKLQSVLKSNCVRQLFLRKRNASVMIQKIFRGYSQRKAFNRKRGTIVIAKSFARKVYYSKYVAFACVSCKWCFTISEYFLKYGVYGVYFSVANCFIVSWCFLKCCVYGVYFAVANCFIVSWCFLKCCVYYARIVIKSCLSIGKFFQRRCIYIARLVFKFLMCHGLLICQIVLHVEYLIGIVCVRGVCLLFRILVC